MEREAWDDSRHTRPALLTVIYTNPDDYQPMIWASRLLRPLFSMTTICREIGSPVYEWPGVEVRRVGPSGSTSAKETASPLRKVREFAGFVRAVKLGLERLKPAVVYAYDPLGLAAVFLARAEPQSVVYQCHDQPEMERLGRLSLQAWLVRYAMRKAKSAALVVYPEKYRALYYMQMAGDDRQPTIVPNCPSLCAVAGPDDFGSLIERRWQRREILYTGTMGPPIGIIEAVRAVSTLQGAPTLRLLGTLRGPGFRERIADTARSLGIEDRVAYEPWIPWEDFYSRTMSASAGLVLYRVASLNEEHMGSATNKLFEYAARGIPAVVPDRKSFREFLVDESWVAYADPARPESIGQALRWIFADRERYAAMCRAARRAFEEKYNYEHVFSPVLDRILALARLAVPTKSPLNPVQAQEPCPQAGFRP